MSCACDSVNASPAIRDYPHDSTCHDCGAPHAHPGTHECADRHACDVRALTHDVERVCFDLRSAEKAHIETLATLARRKEADRELVLAVDELLREVRATDAGPRVAALHDKVRRLITSDLYQSMLGIRL